MITEQDQRVLDNMGLVFYWAGKLRRHPYVFEEFDELVGDGMEGLVVAAQTYDEKRGAFNKYASQVIRNSIHTGCRNRNHYWAKYRLSFEGLAADHVDKEVGPEEIVVGTDYLNWVSKASARRTSRGPEVCALLSTGMNAAQIGRALGVSPARVHQIIAVTRQEIRDREAVG